MNLQRQLLICVDHIVDKKQYHLKYLRFPNIDYKQYNQQANLLSANENNSIFYLMDSKNPIYRNEKNVTARNQYINKFQRQTEQLDKFLNHQYLCLNPKSFNQQKLARVDTKNSCTLVNGKWIP